MVENDIKCILASYNHRIFVKHVFSTSSTDTLWSSTWNVDFVESNTIVGKTENHTMSEKRTRTERTEEKRKKEKRFETRKI